MVSDRSPKTPTGEHCSVTCQKTLRREDLLREKIGTWATHRRENSLLHQVKIPGQGRWLAKAGLWNQACAEWRWSVPSGVCGSPGREKLASRVSSSPHMQT